jgi:hypothetical protein
MGLKAHAPLLLQAPPINSVEVAKPEFCDWF